MPDGFRRRWNAQQPSGDPDFPVNRFPSGRDVKLRRRRHPALLLDCSLELYCRCGIVSSAELGYDLEIQTPGALAKESHQDKL